MAIFEFEKDNAPAEPQQQEGQGTSALADDLNAANVAKEPKSPRRPIPANIAAPMSPVPQRVSRLKPQLAVESDLVEKKGQKKRKKKKSMRPTGVPDVAEQTIRGFHTPMASGGEESDLSVVSTPRLGPTSGFPSVTSSPALRPSSAAGGISSLKQRLERLDLNGSRMDFITKGSPGMKKPMSEMSSNTSVSGLSDSDRTELDSYEVNLEHDFISSQAPSKSATMTSAISNPLERTQSYVRKMSAEDFEPLTCLGKGSYGTVLLVKQRGTGRLYAQKQFKKASLTVHKKLIEQTKTERAILESVNRHPFVVKLYYAFQDHEKLYLILEYAQGGELFHHLEKERMFTEDVAAFYMAEMVLALTHLHRNVGVVYRDLKPENCLLDAEGHLLLTDFGLSKVAVDEDDTCRSILGTVEYMAPEVIQGAEYGMAVDWWSFGALGYDLMTGSPPFTGNNNAKIQEKIIKQKLSLPYYLGPDAKDLLTRLLRKDPKKRLGGNMPKDLQTIKSHRFFRKIDWKKLEARELDPPIVPLITDPESAENFASDFTALPLSPVATRGKSFDEYMAEETNPFGGFSFVASSSLLEKGDWGY